MHGERWSGRIRTYASGLLVLTCCLLGSTFLGTGTAYADAYRYWGFYQSNEDGWAFAKKGPAQVTPKDGAVDGWRYAIAGDSTGDRVPRTAVTFDEICGDTETPAGQKRVAVVLDFGLEDEAPDGQTPEPARGECAVVEQDASSAQVLAEVAEVREDKGLVCAVDGFPTSGCGDPVSDEPKVPNPEPTVELELPDIQDDAAQEEPAEEKPAADKDNSTENQATGSEADSGFPVLPVVGGAIVVLLVGGGVWQYNRRRGNAS